jgi:hypothetical protein
MVVFVIKCTTTWLGILCSNTSFPHNVYDIDLEDIGVICPEIVDLDPDKSRGCCDFIPYLVDVALICIHVATRFGSCFVRKPAS